MSGSTVLVALVVIVVLLIAVKGNEASLRLMFRAQWGKPRDQPRKLDLILESHRSRLAADASLASLDDRTWDDLNLDAVFATLDRTESTLGQHALYHRLRSVPTGHRLEAFDALVERMGADDAGRERAQVALSRLRDPQGYDLWWLGEPDAVDAPPWFAIFPVLTLSTVGFAVYGAFWIHSLWTVVGAVGAAWLVSVTTLRRLADPIAAFRRLAPLIATAERLTFLEGEDIDPIVGAIRREVPGLLGLKTVSRWVSSNPLLLPLQAGMLATLVNDFLTVVYQDVSLALVLDGNAVFFGVRGLRARASALLQVMDAMGDVDAAIAVASFRAGTTGWTRPAFCLPGEPMALRDIRHPLVADAVGNSIDLAPPHGVLITGSNMSGKSTFLRTVGVSAVLAQTIGTCVAEEYRAPIVQVRSGIGRGDDLMQGKSYYLVEVEALVELVRASESDGPHLFLLDELFRGTNAVERIAAGEAVLRALILDGGKPKRRHVVIAATHDSELLDLLGDHYAAFHFGDSLGPSGLAFDYHLEPGPATTRNAITLLRLNGAPESLVEGALARAAELDRARKIQARR